MTAQPEAAIAPRVAFVNVEVGAVLLARAAQTSSGSSVQRVAGGESGRRDVDLYMTGGVCELWHSGVAVRPSSTAGWGHVRRS